MAARRGKSQARRRGGGGNAGLPGWAWLVLGVVLTIAAIFIAPRFMGNDEADGFFRPRPNPDAQPAPVALDGPEAAAAPEQAQPRRGNATPAASAEGSTQPAEFDFYTVLPGQEVVMTDAQIAAAAREEQARREREQRQQQAQAEAARPQAIDATTAPAAEPRPQAPATPSAPSAPASVAASEATPRPAETAPAPAPAAAQPPAARSNDTPYILQAGAFQASGDAEALKARIALLGLNARVESAQISGNTVYRVRMGPYATASELSEAQAKLSSGGLPAMAIRAR